MYDAQLEVTRSSIIGRMRSEGGYPQLGNMPHFVVNGEELAKSYLSIRCQEIIAIQTKCDLVAGNQLVKGSTKERFVSAVTESSPYHTECRLDVISLDRENLDDKRVRRSGPIKSPGRFKRFAVTLPSSLSDAATPVLEHGQLILDTAYSWIADQILEFTDARELHVAEGLYSLARELFPEPNYRRELWFATVGPLYGFRLIASEVVDGALRTYSEGVRDLPISPLDLLARLLASCLPRNLLLMDAAARRDGAMDVDVSNAGYAHDPYAYVMKSLYGSTSFTIYPLLTRSHLSVMALFPTGRQAILSRLEAHKGEFSDRARDLASAIEESARLFEVVETKPEETDEPSVKRLNIGHLVGQTVEAARAEAEHRRVIEKRRFRFLR
jgi:hypothetical protein